LSLFCFRIVIILSYAPQPYAPLPSHPQDKCVIAEKALTQAKIFVKSEILVKQALLAQTSASAPAAGATNPPPPADNPVVEDSDESDVDSDEEEEEQAVSQSRYLQPNKTVLQQTPFAFPVQDKTERVAHDYTRNCDKIM
jgi:hypothetical protein